MQAAYGVPTLLSATVNEAPQDACASAQRAAANSTEVSHHITRFVVAFDSSHDMPYSRYHATTEQRTVTS